MSIFSIIKSRRTIKAKDYTGERIDDSLIEQLLEAATWAPTHGLTEPWQFTVFCDAGLEKLSEFQSRLYKIKTPAEEFVQDKYDGLLNNPLRCSHVIALGMRRQDTQKIAEWEEIAAVSCAVQNMMLLATELGIATFWNSGGVTKYPETKEFLNLREQDKFLGWLYVGVANPELTFNSSRQPASTKTTWVN